MKGFYKNKLWLKIFIFFITFTCVLERVDAVSFSSSAKEKCIDEGNYYNTDTSKASEGCYALDEENCRIFGFKWDNGTCDISTVSITTSTTTMTTTVPIEDKYNINFNIMNGYMDGFVCPNYTSPTSIGVCSGYVDKGAVVEYPTNQKNLVHVDSGALVGWTTNSENCVVGSVDDDLSKTSIQVNSDTNLYACYKLDVNGLRYALSDASVDGQNVPCGSSLNITWCKRNLDDSEWCNYDKIGEESRTGWVNRDRITLDEPAKDACDVENVEEKNEIVEDLSDIEKKCPSKSSLTQKNISGEHSFEMCHETDLSNEEVKSEIKDLVICKVGYVFDDSYTYASDEKAKCNDYICKREYTVRCVKESVQKPTLSVKSGVAGSDGTGAITVKASSSDAEIVAYYVSEEYKTPTKFSNWIDIENNEFTISGTAGVRYIWVKDSNGNISNCVSGAIIDTINNNNTLKKLELYDANGNVNVPKSVSYNIDGVVSNQYVRLSNDLIKNSVISESGFNPFDSEYKLEVSSPTITVYATLTSTDSNYVKGYEPRTVNLDYGINTVLIKIQDNEGKIRSYTILVTRVDDRTSDNTLSDMSVNVGDIEFNANVTDYKIEIPAGTSNVNVDSKLSSERASYVEGYEPGNVEITGDTTVKLIKVKSETGSTRTYVLTFVKEGTDVINKTSLQLFSLDIPGVNIPFEEDIANYSLSVGYETDVIDISSSLKDSDSNSVISVKKKNDNEYKLVSGNGVLLDVGENFIEIKVTDKDNNIAYYRMTVIRKEFGLEVSNDTTLNDLKVLGYDIGFEPNKKEYTVRIKREKSLVITAVPNNNRSEVFIRGNDELTGFSTVRIKVVAENGDFETYSIDIKKDAFNKTIEIIAVIVGISLLVTMSSFIIIKNKYKTKKDYYNE